MSDIVDFSVLYNMIKNNYPLPDFKKKLNSIDLFLPNHDREIPCVEIFHTIVSTDRPEYMTILLEAMTIEEKNKMIEIYNNIADRIRANLQEEYESAFHEERLMMADCIRKELKCEPTKEFIIDRFFDFSEPVIDYLTKNHMDVLSAPEIKTAITEKIKKCNYFLERFTAAPPNFE